MPLEKSDSYQKNRSSIPEHDDGLVDIKRGWINGHGVFHIFKIPEVSLFQAVKNGQIQVYASAAADPLDGRRLTGGKGAWWGNPADENMRVTVATGYYNLVDVTGLWPVVEIPNDEDREKVIRCLPPEKDSEVRGRLNLPKSTERLCAHRWEFYKKGAVWFAGRAGAPTHLPGSLTGYERLHYLLSHPRKPIPCGLVFCEGNPRADGANPGVDVSHLETHSYQLGGIGNAGFSYQEKHDYKSRKEMKKRLEELQRIAECSTNPEEKASARQELAQYKKELSGKTERSFISPSEKSMITSTRKTIFKAIAEILAACPEMKDLLNKDTVIIRETCRFTQDTSEWMFDPPAKEPRKW